jgi:hypothetical protein
VGVVAATALLLLLFHGRFGHVVDNGLCRLHGGRDVRGRGSPWSVKD